MIYRIQTYVEVDGAWKWDDVYCYKDGFFDVDSSTWVESANSIGSLTFDMLPTAKYYDVVDINSRVRILNAEGWTDTGDYYGFKCVFAGRVIEVTPQMDDDGLIHKEVVCEDALGFLQDSMAWFDSEKTWFDAGNKNYPVEIDADGVRTMGAEDFIKLVIGQHNSTVAANDKTEVGKSWKHIYIGDIDLKDYGDDDDDRKTKEQLEIDVDPCYDKTSYELLSEACEELGAQFCIKYDDDNVKPYLYVSKQLGEENVGTFEVGDNIAQSALETSISATATRLFPWGDEYAKLQKNNGSGKSWMEGTNISGRLKGEEWKTTKSAVMTRFNVKDGLKVHVIIGKRDKDYASVFFTSKAITTANDKKNGTVLRKYTTKAETGDDLEKWYSVPEDAKFCYVYGAKSTGTKLALFSEYTREVKNLDSKTTHTRTIKDKYKVGLGFWLDYLKNADKKAALKDFGLKLGSVTDKSDDKLYYLCANEDKFGIIEGSFDIDRCHLKTEKITDASSKITSITDCVTVGKKKDKRWRQKRARLFFREACRQAAQLCNESVTVSATAYDLRAGRYESYPELHLFDQWRLHNDKCGIDHLAQVTRISRDIREPWKVDVEFGDKASRYTRSASSSTGELSTGNAGDDSGQDSDDAADEYSTLVNQYADAAEEAAAQAVQSADELDSLSRQIQVDSLAAGQMASEAYDTVHPITQAMRDALDQAEQQAHELTAVKEGDSKTIEVVNDLARAVATYSYETERSVVAWRQTYTASMDAWASEDDETQAKIKAAYAKLYGDGGTADNPTADSAQGKLNSAKAANVTAAQKEAQMRTELASAKAYQESCVSTASAQQEAYEKALANYNELKTKTAVKKRQIDAAWTALQASLARRDESQAAVDAADKRVAEAESNYAAAQKELESAEQKVSDAAAEVETAMNGIHELYSSTVEQTAQKVAVSVSKTDMDGAISSAAVTIKADAVETAVSKVDAKGYQTYSDVTQTLSGWTWKIADSDAAAYMSFTNEAGTGTLTLGGKASAITLGGDSSTLTLGGSKSTLDMSGVAVVNIGTSGRCSVNIGTGSSDDVYSTINMGGSFSTINIGCMTIMQSTNVNYSSIKGTEQGSGISFYNSSVFVKPSDEVNNAGLWVDTSGVSVGNASSMNTGTVECGNIECVYNIECNNITADRQVNSQGAYMNINIGPASDGSSSCGSGSYRWSKVYAKNGTIDTSSREVKENIEPESEEKAARLLDVEVVKFDYKRDYWGSDDNKGWYGVIAEDVHGLFPEAVIDWDTGTETDDRTGESVKVYPGVAYSTFIPHLIKLCQMQQAQIDDLTARVAALEGGAE